MRTFLILLLLTPLAFANGQSCHPDTATTLGLVVDLRRMLTTTDAREIAANDSFYHVPVLPPNSVAPVTSQSICAKAVAALNALHGEAKTRVVHVATVGRGFAVIDPLSDPSGRFITVVIFDERWRRVGGFTGP